MMEKEEFVIWLLATLFWGFGIGTFIWWLNYPNVGSWLFCFFTCLITGAIWNAIIRKLS